ncbi:hypothetical protein QJS04_geneDACA004527 [Acorus gramineus]|uniref:Uncharacterized protein n=1 Tax=Acorus gramineus TaxID=55184 RepID=A0AAV9BUJ2_ACOGR|nr:hypothetical protein QJS04_geneDACA004527 [Acorus gramineus]
MKVGSRTRTGFCSPASSVDTEANLCACDTEEETRIGRRRFLEPPDAGIRSPLHIPLDPAVLSNTRPQLEKQSLVRKLRRQKTVLPGTQGSFASPSSSRSGVLIRLRSQSLEAPPRLQNRSYWEAMLSIRQCIS